MLHLDCQRQNLLVYRHLILRCEGVTQLFNLDQNYFNPLIKNFNFKMNDIRYNGLDSFSILIDYKDFIFIQKSS